MHFMSNVVLFYYLVKTAWNINADGDMCVGTNKSWAFFFLLYKLNKLEQKIVPSRKSLAK